MQIDDYIFSLKEKLQKINLIYVFGGLSVLCIGFISYSLFNYWNVNRQKSPAREFFDLLERYNNVTQQDKEFPVEELIEEMDNFYKKNTHSVFREYAKYLSFFLSVKLDKTLIDKDFIKLIDNKKNLDNDIIALYALYSALVMLDDENNDNSTKGKEIIDILCNEKDSVIKDMASFMYGWHLFVHYGYEKAFPVWGYLINDPSRHQSPYCALVKKAINWEL